MEFTEGGRQQIESGENWQPDFSKAPQDPAPSPQHPAPFELVSGNLRVEFKAHGVPLVHVLKRPTNADWLEWARQVSTIYQSDGEALEAETVGELEATVRLWDKLLISIDGYRAQGTIGKERIPVSHKEMAIRGITRVMVKQELDGAGREQSSAGFLLDLDTQPVELEVDGLEHAPLIHHFRIPGLNDFKDYKRIMAESRIVGGTKHFKTVMPSRLPGIVGLYDRLIERVEGYAIEGELPADKTAIVKNMDAHHKLAALMAAFEPPQESTNG